eukprot:4831918-Amphidinium_carterae.1
MTLYLRGFGYMCGGCDDLRYAAGHSWDCYGTGGGTRSGWSSSLCPIQALGSMKAKTILLTPNHNQPFE